MTWHGDGLHGRGGLLGHIGAHAVLAVPAPGDDVSVHLLPDDAGGQEPPGGMDTRMGKLVEGVEDCWAVLDGNEGVGRGEGDDKGKLWRAVQGSKTLAMT